MQMVSLFQVVPVEAIGTWFLFAELLEETAVQSTVLAGDFVMQAKSLASLVPWTASGGNESHSFP